MASEDFNQLKRISHRLARADFQHPWDFRLEISGMRKDLENDFDLLVKDISYGPVTIETEAIKAGGITLTFPVGTEPVSLTMTIRDLSTRPFSKFFDKWAKSVANENGTFNLQTQYLKRVSRISLSNPDDVETWYMLPTKRGDITESVDGEGLLEIPYTMIQFRSLQWDGNDANLSL